MFHVYLDSLYVILKIWLLDAICLKPRPIVGAWAVQGKNPPVYRFVNIFLTFSIFDYSFFRVCTFFVVQGEKYVLGYPKRMSH